MRKLSLALCASVMLCATAISTPVLATNGFADTPSATYLQGDTSNPSNAVDMRTTAADNPAGVTDTNTSGRDSINFVTDTIADAGGLVHATQSSSDTR